MGRRREGGVGEEMRKQKKISKTSLTSDQRVMPAQCTAGQPLCLRGGRELKIHVRALPVLTKNIES